MNFLLNFCIFTFYTISALVSSYTVPEATVEVLEPKGFRLSIPQEEEQEEVQQVKVIKMRNTNDFKVSDELTVFCVNEDGISEVSFNVKINSRINIYQPGDFAAKVKERTNDIWAFDNINTSVKPGDEINYWVHVNFANGKNLREVGTAVVSNNSVQLLNFCPDKAQECSTAIEKVECQKSATTVRGKHMCKDELIFEDNFDELDWSKWSREVRIPMSSDDGQFVMFLEKPKNCNVKNGQLHITPSLSSEVLGNDVKRIRNGEYNLGAQCTAFLDKSQECKKKAQFYQILPPVVSAKINTKYSFSFRYGRVEIKARLPKGDWLFPLILLEPLENYYGIQNYMSGQIRIAFNRGNDVLQDSNYTDISNKWLFGGAVMSNLDKYRNYFLRGTKIDSDLSADFHTYSLTWTDDQFILAIDGKIYTQNFIEDFSKWLVKFHGQTIVTSKMAPFDKEFYLALGVSAGGHSDFPDDCRSGIERTPKPWKNGDPKAELSFWKNIDNWSRTWSNDGSGLHVDYVKVYAL